MIFVRLIDGITFLAVWMVLLEVANAILCHVHYSKCFTALWYFANLQPPISVLDF